MDDNLKGYELNKVLVIHEPNRVVFKGAATFSVMVDRQAFYNLGVKVLDSELRGLSADLQVYVTRMVTEAAAAEQDRG